NEHVDYVEGASGTQSDGNIRQGVTPKPIGTTALMWVKQHGFSMMAFNEDELSVIATKLGTPLMIDSYTSDMCMQSWGRSSYIRAMIELQANIELKETIMVAMPKLVVVKKKQAEVLRQEVSNSNPFNVLNSIENDDDLGTNVGISKLIGAHGSSSNTLIIDKIDKLERQMLDGKLIFVDNDGNPLVPTGNVDSENEVKVAICDDLDITVRGRKKK
ncbi:hypothetical protein Tco_1049323, partial [Tanacetum coccineum]